MFKKRYSGIYLDLCSFAPKSHKDISFDLFRVSHFASSTDHRKVLRRDAVGLHAPGKF